MTHGMVSAPQPEAVEAGLDILSAGGNAVDAAIGAALVQTAVDPQMCGIAGFGSCHVVLADGTHKLIDFHGAAPQAVTPDMWEDRIVRECDDGFGFVLEGEVNEIGYQSMTTPMTLRAFDDILTRWGTKSMAQMLEPAIAYCEDGFAVRPHVHGFWTRPAEAGRIARVRGQTEYPATAKIYTKPTVTAGHRRYREEPGYGPHVPAHCRGRGGRFLHRCHRERDRSRYETQRGADHARRSCCV